MTNSKTGQWMENVPNYWGYVVIILFIIASTFLIIAIKSRNRNTLTPQVRNRKSSQFFFLTVLTLLFCAGAFFFALRYNITVNHYNKLSNTEKYRVIKVNATKEDSVIVYYEEKRTKVLYYDRLYVKKSDPMPDDVIEGVLLESNGWELDLLIPTVYYDGIYYYENLAK